MRSVQYVRSEHRRAQHPTQKPLAIIAPLLRYACPIGGRVLDPFAGSGSVGVCAKQEGMDATMIEISADYCAIADARIRDDVPLFAEVAAE